MGRAHAGQALGLEPSLGRGRLCPVVVGSQPADPLLDRVLPCGWTQKQFGPHEGPPGQGCHGSRITVLWTPCHRCPGTGVPRQASLCPRVSSPESVHTQLPPRGGPAIPGPGQAKLGPLSSRGGKGQGNQSLPCLPPLQGQCGVSPEPASGSLAKGCGNQLGRRPPGSVPAGKSRPAPSRWGREGAPTVCPCVPR